jgi:hypothetical protein
MAGTAKLTVRLPPAALALAHRSSSRYRPPANAAPIMVWANVGPPVLGFTSRVSFVAGSL